MSWFESKAGNISYLFLFLFLFAKVRTGCPLLVLVNMVISVIPYTNNKITHSSHLINSRYAIIVITTILYTFVCN